jgi:lanosterol synthase
LGLVSAGENENSKEIKKACDYLVKHQMNDGGWGESYLSCVDEKYVQSERSQIVNTSWALLSLMLSNYHDRNVIDKGIQIILKRQYENGDFPQENINGVFNGNCMISYPNFKNIFPLWALGVYNQKYLNKE